MVQVKARIAVRLCMEASVCRRGAGRVCRRGAGGRGFGRRIVFDCDFDKVINR